MVCGVLWEVYVSGCKGCEVWEGQTRKAEYKLEVSLAGMRIIAQFDNVPIIFCQRICPLTFPPMIHRNVI